MNAKLKTLFHTLPLLLICGCGETPPTNAESLDAQIDESWIEGRTRANAVRFFERGGVYSSSPEFPDIDRRIVLPLVKRLEDECGLTVEALLEHDEPNIAFALIADISEIEDRSGIATICQEADQSSPELVLENWGDRWISIDILDENITDQLQESGDLEPLTGHLERLRAEFGAEPAAAN